jgi:Tfp pilus assembly protein PilF
MVRVLVVSAEPRLVDALAQNFDDDAQVHAVAQSQEAQQALVAEGHDLVFLDYEVFKNDPPGAFVAIDNVIQQEHGTGVLLVRKATPESRDFARQYQSIQYAIDLNRGRDQFDERARTIYSKTRKRGQNPGEDPSVSTDRVVRREIDLPALERGELGEMPIARLLHTIHQRKETGRLKLTYASHVLDFGFVGGELVESSQFEPARELLGAFAWSHGQYEFIPEEIDGPATSVLPLIAEGCRDHVRQRIITDVMSPIMRRYPVVTNIWFERQSTFDDYQTLQDVLSACDGNTNWEKVLSGLGQKVTDGFRAAYFAIHLDLVETMDQAGFEGVAVQYSREVRRAREKVEQAEVEKTKAYQASSGAGRSKLERELAVQLQRMKEQTPHERFGVWEGCGRKVVQDRFYVLVREHHPDVYGGNTSGNVRSLAQDIFILIKESYQKLLATEKQQTVPPPESEASVGPQTTPRPSRPRHDTPRLDAKHRTSSATGRRSTSGAGTEPAGKEDDRPQVDVKSKLSQLSGYRKKQKHRERLKSYSRRNSSSGGKEDDSLAAKTAEQMNARVKTNTPRPQPQEEKGPDPEEQEKAERQAKLDHLLRRAQRSAPSDAPKPAREFFNKGYSALSEERKKDALEHFERAHDLEPDNGLYMTFYARMLFELEADELEKTEKLLREALSTGNRQSAPDAFLYLGHVCKKKGEEDEALKYYKRALRLNPSCREAEREIRLAEKRGGRTSSDPGSFIKNLFKK